MPQGTVRVHGLRELNRDFGRISKDLKGELDRELLDLAEPVASSARSKAARFGPKTVRGIKAGRSRGGAVVRQRTRKTTGLHPEFGALQMRTAFEPALTEHEREILGSVENMLDRLTSEHGFGRGGTL